MGDSTQRKSLSKKEVDKEGAKPTYKVKSRLSGNSFFNCWSNDLFARFPDF